MLGENRNISEVIILVTLQNPFEMKLSTDLDLSTNFWERERERERERARERDREREIKRDRERQRETQRERRLPITNNEISA